jgi:hypothetical protein
MNDIAFSIASGIIEFMFIFWPLYLIFYTLKVVILTRYDY